MNAADRYLTVPGARLRYRDAGVARLLFNLPAAKSDEVLPVLDRCAALMRPVQS